MLATTTHTLRRCSFMSTASWVWEVPFVTTRREPSQSASMVGSGNGSLWPLRTSRGVPRSAWRNRRPARRHNSGFAMASMLPASFFVERPTPIYPDAEVEQLSKRLDDARGRRDKLRDVGMASDHVDREILELRRQLREGGQLRAGDALCDGRFLLVNVVGQGGFAVVWDAYDCVSQQRVAITVLHANLAGDPLRRERFFRGAQAMMKLVHPAVARVLEPRGEDGGFYYFVMEFAPGGNLREAVLAQRVRRAELLPLILQVGDALALTHDRRMVH